MSSTKTKTNSEALAAPVLQSTHWSTSKWFVLTITSVVTLGMGTSAGAWSNSVSQTETILPRVSIGGVDVSELTYAEALAKVQAVADSFTAQPFEFTGTSEEGETKQFELSAADLGMTVDVPGSVAAAFELGHDANKLKNVASQVSVAFGGGHLNAAIIFDQDLLDGAFETAFLEIERPAKNARLSYVPKPQDDQANEPNFESGLVALPPELGNEIIREPAYSTLQNSAEHLRHETITLTLGPTQPDTQLDDLAASQTLAQKVLDSELNFYYEDKNYSPSVDELGSWLEFMTIKPVDVQGKDACACGLPEKKLKRGEEPEPDTADLPSITITPFDQERRGDEPTDPYTVLLPPQNFSRQELPRFMPVVGINKDKLTHWLLETASADLDVAGENARLAFVDGEVKITKASKAGIGVDVGTAIEDTLFSVATTEPHVRLALVEKKPAINEDIIDELGITTKIADGWSDATNSSANRIQNINRGFELLTGLVIAPGEEFSTIEAIAPIDGYNGYVPELVITGTKLRPEYGGGLCQVGTTLFRAAMDGGFEITERENHAFEVFHYIKPYPDFGVEATLYDSHPDFRFVNDTEGYVLINAYLDDDLIAHVEFYGTDPGRTTTIDGPYRISGSPYAGGSTVFTYTVTDDKSGQVVRTEDFYSNFQPASKFKLEGSEDKKTD